MELIKRDFNIDEKEFEKIVYECTEWVTKEAKELAIKDYHLFHKHFPYLEELKASYDEQGKQTYLQFGADKCSVNDFELWCKEINVDLFTNMARLINQPGKGPFHFYNDDRTLTFTCNVLDQYSGYLHYLGVTGTVEKVLGAYEVFNKRMKYSDICLGTRTYV